MLNGSTIRDNILVTINSTTYTYLAKAAGKELNDSGEELLQTVYCQSNVLVRTLL